MCLTIDHKRYRSQENKGGIDEEKHIFVPGLKLFDVDNLYKWLKRNAHSEINLDLLFHKFPRWFKILKDNGSISDLVTTYEFKIPKHKNANPGNPKDYKKKTHNYKKEHLEAGTFHSFSSRVLSLTFIGFFIKVLPDELPDEALPRIF